MLSPECRSHLPFLEVEAAAAEAAASECQTARDHASASEAAQQQGVDALEQERAQLEAAVKAACRSQAKASNEKLESLN